MNAKFSNLRDSCSSSLSSLNSLPNRQHHNRRSCRRLRIYPADSTEDLKKDMKELLNMDDFDECRARANSGGSLYGVLRKKVLQRGGVTASSFKEQPSSIASLLAPSSNTSLVDKQRSRSMTNRGVSPVTAKDKGILMIMCEYTEKKRKLHGQDIIRRHSAAVLQSCQRQNSVKKPSNLTIPSHQQFLKPISPLCSNVHRSSIQNQRLHELDDADNFTTHRLKRTLTPGRYSRCRSRPSNVSFNTPQLLSVPSKTSPKVTVDSPDFGKRNFLLPPTESPQDQATPHRPSVSFQTPEPALHSPDRKNIARFSIVSNTPVMTFCRRRSFSLTQEGTLVNDGDEMITIPTSPATLGTPGEVQDSSPTLSLPMEGDFIPGVCYGTAQRSRTASIFSSLFQGEQSSGIVQNLSTTQTPTATPRPSTNSFHKYRSPRQPSISPRANVFRILMLGGPGVGKTALAQQFVTSEYMAAENTSFDDGIAIPIPILLEGEESVLEFIDLPYTGELDTWREYEVDAYIIVYSITDRRSYQKTVDLLYSIREGDGHLKQESKKPIIVVANKSDLERSRIVGKEEGRTLAEMYGSKYIDVSAILNHKVDDLLVGILKQVRLNQSAALLNVAHVDSSGRGGGGGGRRSPHQNKLQSRDDSGEVGCFAKSKHPLLTRLVRRTSRRKRSRSCENLLRL